MVCFSDKPCKGNHCMPLTRAASLRGIQCPRWVERPGVRGFLAACWLLLGLFGNFSALLAQVSNDDQGVVRAEEQPASARLVSVPLPITGSVDLNVIQNIDHLIEQFPQEGPRPILVLELKATEQQTGIGSQFERSLALARYLAGERLRRVRTVAYVPQSVQGHAVLVALACEEIIVAPDATFGDAGAGEPFIDPTMRRGYLEIADRRRVIPAPVALGLLDKQTEVFKVQTTDGMRYVPAAELDELQKQSAVRSVDRVSAPGEMIRLTGRDLRVTYGFASHLASDRTELAAALKIPPASLQEDPTFRDGWRALQIDIHGPINRNSINWITRSLETRLAQDSVNFLCLTIDSPGGDLDTSLAFAQRLARLDPARIRTVAFVPKAARADAALIALACQQLVVGDEAVLGGPGEPIAPQSLVDLRQPLAQMAAERGDNWSLALALLDSSVQVHTYTREGTGEVRFLCNEELASLPDAAQWKQGAALRTADGLNGRDAQSCKLARYRANQFDEVRQLYSLAEPPAVLRPNWAHRLIEGLADPRIAGLLLFIAWFALMIEFMTQGFSGAGLVSAICFLLYFWSQFLHGTAGWLEVLLFLGGAVCVAIEIFLLPGFGIVGITGGIMMIVSIVLASQTFVIPTNDYQLEQMPKSLLVVLAGISGAALALVFMRRYLSRAPIFNRLMLQAPDADEIEEMNRRESLADFRFLNGKRGQTTTPLVPSGKARFGDEIVDVISDGEHIPRNTPVLVSEVRGNRVVVRQLDV